MTIATQDASETQVAQRPSFFPQVHALRAIAVTMVLLYHLWPKRYPGGFIGVDVFLVISGFLITGHIWRQRSQGWAMLPKFWARRVLRLGPSALTVIVAAAALTAVFVPQPLWARFAKEAIASVLISVNFVLYGDAVDYLAAENAPTPFQHYWSLSVEEQFYLVWPILLILAALLARRAFPKSHEIVAVALTVGAVTLASFVASILVLPLSPSAAYFMMPLRMWEFGFGALLALILPQLMSASRPAWLRVIARALLPLSYLLLLLTGLLLTGATPFPGWAALLPVVLTVLVILVHPFAEVPERGAWARIEQGPVVRFLGDVSYSAYLWHWPFIIIVPFALGGALNLPAKLGILGLTLVLAWITTRWIETPLRTLSVWDWKRARRRLLGIAAWAAAAIAAWALMAGVGAAATAQGPFSAAQQEAQCFGANALMHQSECSPVQGSMPDQQALAATAQDLPDPWPDGCVPSYDGDSDSFCNYGDGLAADAPAILLWGDSHAGAWGPALAAAANERGERAYVFSRDGCPVSDVSPVEAHYTGRQMPESEQQNCRARNAQVEAFIADHPEIKTVLIATFSTNYRFPEGQEYGRIDEVMQRVSDGGPEVVRLGDAPLMFKQDGSFLNPVQCLSQAGSGPAACDVAADVAYPAGGQLSFLRGKLGTKLHEIDSTSAFCSDGMCHSLVGGVPIFFDTTHLSNAYSASLSTWLGTELDALKTTG